MAADLHIHIASEKVLAHVQGYLKRGFWSSTIGNAYREYFINGEWVSEDEAINFMEDRVVYPPTRDIPLDYDEDQVYNTPNIWVGEVSWLKAGLFEDRDTYIPKAIDQIARIIGKNLPVVDDVLIEQIIEALTLPNNTIKEGGVWNGKGYAVTDPEKVVEFLEQYKGQRAFTISW